MESLPPVEPISPASPSRRRLWPYARWGLIAGASCLLTIALAYLLMLNPSSSFGDEFRWQVLGEFLYVGSPGFPLGFLAGVLVALGSHVVRSQRPALQRLGGGLCLALGILSWLVIMLAGFVFVVLIASG